MKFGRNYHKRQVAEWADAYMNYGVFKALCKGPPRNVNFQELAARCMAAIDSVERFSRNNYMILLLKLPPEARDRFQHYDAHLSYAAYFGLHESYHVELQHLKVTLSNLVADFDKLRWYGCVNTDAFRKIARKLSTLGNDGGHIASLIEHSLCKSEFASQARCLRILDDLNKSVTFITRLQQEMGDTSTTVQHTFCSRIALVYPSISALPLYRAIESNNSPELRKMIDNAEKRIRDFSRKEFLSILLDCSIRHFSKSCVKVLVSSAISLDLVVVIEEGLRTLILEIGRSTSNELRATPSDHEKSISVLGYILDQLLSRKVDLVSKRDHLGRIPLHYACEHGLTDVCEILLKSVQAWEQFGGDSRSAIFLMDVQSLSSLKLSILGNDPGIMRMLIEFYGHDHDSDHAALS
ncbi:hypothetical protein WAI453_001908 [Rhynchosporium graminicola]